MFINIYFIFISALGGTVAAEVRLPPPSVHKTIRRNKYSYFLDSQLIKELLRILIQF